MKFIMLLVFSFFVTSQILGQKKKWEVGVEGGFGTAANGYPWYIINVLESTGGFSLGISAQNNLNKVFSLKSGIIFGTIEERWDDQGPYASSSADIKMKYIVLPVLVKASFGKKVRFYINAGPCLSFLLDEQKYFSIHDDQTMKDSSYSENPTSKVNRFNIGLSLGMGLDITIKKKFVFDIELRQSGGFNKDIEILHSTELFFGLRYKL